MLLEMAVFNGTAQTGFSDTGREKQQELEQAYQKLLSENEIGGFIKELSARPHSLGSPRTKEIAEKINAWFKSWGWQSQIETYYVLFPTPQYRSLTLLGPKPYHAVLEEKTFVEDALVKKEGGLPPYNAWSADGDVTGG